MKVTKIKKSYMINNSYRIDAPFHLSEGIITRLKIINSPYVVKKLDEVTQRIFLGNIFKRTFVSNSEKGLPYLTGADMIKSNLDTGRFLSKKLTKNQTELMIERNWILLSCSGTIGNVIYTNEDFNDRIGTHDLIRIIPNSTMIDCGFMYAFLKSNYGYNLLTQSNYGGVVKHIEPNQIKNLPIPIFPKEKQKEIHDLIIDAASLRVQANSLLKEAKNLIMSMLPIDLYSNIELSRKNNISSIMNNSQKRIDPTSYLNEGVKNIEFIKQSGISFLSIGEFNIEVRRPGIFKRTYVSSDYGLPYLKGSELSLQNPFSNCVFLSRTRTPFFEELKLINNQILFTCAGTVGNTRLITKEFEERRAIGSQDIIRIESKDNLITSEYLYTYLNLFFVKSFVQSLKYGSVIERVEPFHVKSIPVIVPSDKISREVTKTMNSYKNATYMAFKKEEKAIELVEKEIDSWQN